MYESKRRVNILRITRQTLTKYVIRKFIDLKQYKKNPPNPLVFCEDAIKGDLEMSCTNFYYFFSLNKGEDRRGILPILPKFIEFWYKRLYYKITTLPNGHYDYHEETVYSFLNKDIEFTKEYELTTKLTKEKQIDYISLPAQTSQQIIKILFKNWKSLKDYNKNPSKYKGKPNLQKYKHKIKGKNIVVFTNQQCKIKNGYGIIPGRYYRRYYYRDRFH